MAEKWALVDDNGATILPITSMISITVKSDGKVVSEGIEKGSFASYNKTTAPLSVTASVGFIGTSAELQDIIDKLTKLKDVTDTTGKPIIFSLVTPVSEYKNLTLETFDYNLTREAGRGALYADLNMQEIREVTAEYSRYNVYRASDATTVNRGRVATGTASNSSAADKAKNQSLLFKLSGGET